MTRLTGPERLARLACALLLLGAATIRPAAHAMDPTLHARWWFAHGDWTARPWLCLGPGDVLGGLRGGLGLPRLLIAHTSFCEPSPEECVEHPMQFRRPALDPWGHAWVDAAPAAAPFAAAYAFSPGPDGAWDGGGGDDVAVGLQAGTRPTTAEVLVAVSHDALALLAVTVAITVGLARLAPSPRSLARELLACAALTLVVAAPLALLSDGWRDEVVVEGASIVSTRVALLGTALLVATLSVAALRLALRARRLRS